MNPTEVGFILQSRLPDEFGDFRTDHFAPAAARENAVMARADRVVVELVLRVDAAAQLMRRADMALYRAKSAGRDQLCDI